MEGLISFHLFCTFNILSCNKFLKALKWLTFTLHTAVVATQAWCLLMLPWCPWGLGRLRLANILSSWGFISLVIQCCTSELAWQTQPSLEPGADLSCHTVNTVISYTNSDQRIQGTMLVPWTCQAGPVYRLRLQLKTLPRCATGLWFPQRGQSLASGPWIWILSVWNSSVSFSRPWMLHLHPGTHVRATVRG